MDEEVNRQEAVELLDHLVRCRACRSFYRDARALEGVVQAGASERSADLPRVPLAVPDGLWERIESEARPPSNRRIGGWALRAAAVAVIGLALALFAVPRIDLGNDPALVARAGEEIEVELGSRQGDMTEDRFLEIATEVLEADSRYQRAMFRVMDSVMEDRAPTEGGGDELRSSINTERRGEQVDERSGGRA
jgi:hypothetical protein